MQLRDEVSKVQRVKDYFGPLGLQQPLGAASVAAVADLGEISQEIQVALNPPAANNVVANVLGGISAVLKAGAFAPPPASQVAAGLSGVFASAGYFSQVDGSPNIIGAQVTTSASKLGVELANRYLQAGDNLDDLGRLIVSDYGKLTTVASKANAQPGPGEVDWRLGNVGQARDALRVAGKRMIYERLVPLAFPVLYDIGQISNARDWYCDGGIGFNKRLFNEQADSAQFVARFPYGDGSVRWFPTIAVAAAHAQGNLYDARIPGVPGSVADTLFKLPAAGGVGFTKLQFYSPHNRFRFFPADPTPPNNQTNDRIQQWPYLNGYEDQRIYCVDMPAPPDNSG